MVDVRGDVLRPPHGTTPAIKSDNAATVCFLSSGKGRDSKMLSLDRNVWFVFARSNIQLKACHISSEENRKADLRSRWSLGEVYHLRFKDLFKSRVVVERLVPDELFQLESDI